MIRRLASLASRSGGLRALAWAVSGPILVGATFGGVLGARGSGADDVGQAASAAGGVTVYTCPGETPAGALRGGDRVLVVGRSRDGEWLAVRHVRRASETVFLPAEEVETDADVDDLPERGCDESETIAVAADGTELTPPPSTVPEPSSTSTSSTSSTTPSGDDDGDSDSDGGGPDPPSPGPSTSSTPPPTRTPADADTADPAFGNVFTSPPRITELDGAGIACPRGTPRHSTVTAFVTDDTGVSTVSASWQLPGSRPTSRQLVRSGDTWTTTFGAFRAATLPSGPNDPVDVVVPITLRATDAAGNSATSRTSVTIRRIASCFG